MKLHQQSKVLVLYIIPFMNSCCSSTVFYDFNPMIYLKNISNNHRDPTIILNE